MTYISLIVEPLVLKLKKQNQVPERTVIVVGERSVKSKRGP
jgi:hypothetical protein